MGMTNIKVWDGHCDSLTKWRLEDLLNDRPEAHWTLPKFRAGDGDLQFLAIYTPPEHTGKDAFHYAMKYMEAAHELVEESKGAAEIVLSAGGLLSRRDGGDESPPYNSSVVHRPSSADPIRLVLSLEGASPLIGSVHNLRLFHRMGLRALGFTWNHRNELADGVGVTPSPSGLTEAGFAVLKECERLGILVDVSHLSDPGFWDVYNACTKPFVASHSNAKTLCDHRRNLTDKQIEAVAEKSGTIGLTFVRDFVTAEKATTVPDTSTSASPLRGGGAGEGDDPALPVLVQHARHIAKVGGVQTVAIGSDFDGTDGPVVPDASRFPALASALQSSGFSDADVNAVFHSNFRRVLESIL